MKLNTIVPWGRNFDEYQLMFNLSESELNASILGCGDGPASFNAEMTRQGRSVVSIDPIYSFSATQIRQRVEETYATVISQVKRNSEQYIWKNFRDADELGAARLAAMEGFLADYLTGKQEGRYLAQALPKLSFREQQFELCLCSHLLFLYSEQLSFEFHLDAITELLRVAREVRIFPLIKIDGKPSTYPEPLLKQLSQQGIRTSIQTVGYEFQKGGNQMLCLQA